MTTACSTQEGSTTNGSETRITIQEALNTAVAGGYHIEGSGGATYYYSGANRKYSAWTRTDTHSSIMIPTHETFLDPAFWYALGQALGWDTPCDLAIMCMHGRDECWRCHGAYWMYQWHCFIQQLAEGDTPDAFFARLSLLLCASLQRPHS